MNSEFTHVEELHFKSKYAGDKDCEIFPSEMQKMTTIPFAGKLNLIYSNCVNRSLIFIHSIILT